MSRLHTLRKTAAEVAQYFDIEEPGAVAVPSETTEGHPGLVLYEHQGRRRLRNLDWGFPRLTREMKQHGDDPGRVGLVADLTNPMWDTMVVDPRYRCIIPITHFANPDGDPGKKVRTWFSIEGQPIMAWAGFFRNTDLFGPVYAGMTMDANQKVMPYNDRMPVLLEPGEIDRWLHGSIQDVIHFQFRAPVAAERTIIQHTDDAWRSGKPPVTEFQTALL